jgi:NAD(P)-dependent dehydrogenase (short-subunit alcohol dehydrogenase family)
MGAARSGQVRRAGERQARDHLQCGLARGIEGERLRSQFAPGAAARGESVDAAIGRFAASTALGRIVTGADVAAAVIHLASPGGAQITGQDLVVDSGTIV